MSSLNTEWSDIFNIESSVYENHGALMLTLYNNSIAAHGSDFKLPEYKDNFDDSQLNIIDQQLKQLNQFKKWSKQQSEINEIKKSRIKSSEKRKMIAQKNKELKNRIVKLKNRVEILNQRLNTHK